MESHEALRLLVGGDALAMAKRLGRSPSLMHKWCEPSLDFTDCGAYNPLDRIAAMMEEAIRLKKPSLQVYAPIRFLAEGHGVFIPLPKESCSIAQITIQTAKVIKEVGEALAVAGAALENQALSPNKRREIAKEVDEALHALATYQGMVNHG